MKKIIFITFAIFSFNLLAANCTQTTRSNYNALQVLKASDLNADFNQLVSKSNAMDGGCISDGTLETAALNSTEFATVTNGIHQGCPLIFVDENTIGVGKCILSVNGNLVKTTVQNNVTWGCAGCSAESASTQYYIYAKANSLTTTLNLLISTTAPGTDGYDGAGNKVLGKFFNNYDNKMEGSEVLSWANNFYAPTSKVMTIPGSTIGVSFFSFVFNQGGGACTSGVCTTTNLFGDTVLSVTRTGTGTYDADLKYNYDVIFCSITYSKGGSYSAGYADGNTPGVDMRIYAYNSAGAATDYAGRAICFASGKF